jgi:hypothetical protein
MNFNGVRWRKNTKTVYKLLIIYTTIFACCSILQSMLSAIRKSPGYCLSLRYFSVFRRFLTLLDDFKLGSKVLKFMIRAHLYTSCANRTARKNSRSSKIHKLSNAASRLYTEKAYVFVTFARLGIWRRCVRVINACESFWQALCRTHFIDGFCCLSFEEVQYNVMTNRFPNQSTGLFLYWVDARLGQRSSRLSNKAHLYFSLWV